MAMTLEHCPNCFRNIQGHKGCPHCGYDDFERNNLLALPLNVTLHERYMAGRILGSGGFGITYKAYDKKAGKLCAIKEYVPLGYSNRSSDSVTLTATSSDKEEIYEYGKKRFLEEANILSTLHYISSVVEISDCFCENGTAYFVMEYIEGITLNQKRREYPGGRVPFSEASRIIKSVGACLNEVHTKGGIFHRDVSPENIMIRRDGVVKLIDFGTAKYIHGRKTQNLSIILKPGYAPPEQYSSTGNQGEYTDVYALAATFYVILTGKKIPPAPERIGGDATVEPPWKLLGEKYRDVSKMLDQALEVKIERRTPTMKVFLRQLEQCMNQMEENSGKPTKTLSRPERPRPYLDGLQGAISGYRFPLPVNTIVTIGRRPDNDIVIPEKVIGRRHLEIFYDTSNGLFYLVDNDSVNGTYVNGRRCRSAVIIPVRPGDIVSLAQNVCVFQLGVADE